MRLRRSLEATVYQEPPIEDDSQSNMLTADAPNLTLAVQDDRPCSMECGHGECHRGRAVHGFAAELLEDVRH